MKIAQQRNSEAVQAVGPAPQRELAMNNARTVGLEEDGVAGKGDCASGGCLVKKPTSCYGNQFVGINDQQN